MANIKALIWVMLGTITGALVGCLIGVIAPVLVAVIFTLMGTNAGVLSFFTIITVPVGIIAGFIIGLYLSKRNLTRKKKIVIISSLPTSLVILLGIIYFCLLPSVATSTYQTKSFICIVERELNSHWKDTGEYITSISEYTEYVRNKSKNPSFAVTKDAWSHPFIFESSNNIPQRIISLGKDGVPHGKGKNADLVLEIEYQKNDDYDYYSRKSKIYVRN